jgi:GDP-4-dehydro-6-deoxy-D-mannose reductase
VSKVAQDKFAYQYFKSHWSSLVGSTTQAHGAEPTSLRAPSRVRALIEAGQHEPVIYHGDLTSKRDRTDVRDMVRAYWLALERGEAGEVSLPA